MSHSPCRAGLVACCLSVLMLAMLLASSAPAGATDISPGRLFFTPAQRAMLDRQNRGEPASGAAPVQTAAPPARINGFVRRSDGALTTWIDSTPEFQRNSGASFTSIPVETPNRIVVRPARSRPADNNAPR